ncbi:hypothetical protein JWH11_04380 [Xanthomonas melonis]|uniref:Outer membrane protein beta-barrel domain-containing protein n=1 Tax=Xanthomonas melonis TaxID=56456 RepID=A0ABS8NRJ2_9XANT|nr:MULTISPECIES: hypothetical protein [Xanthomonas]MCC4587626.1 hypothetical protein [Xanthomonas sp. NCPPB 1067]MCD0245583.1 hypothetical protein [Xanthomonas melonis]MCD0257462.1 hypothetical protein [Xanthomonas melonis]MCD0265682.1 hypothetical protein [Xanthomonas melonis]
MKRTATLLLACTALGVTAQASAQSLSRGWDSYRQQNKQQQAGPQGGAAPTAPLSRPPQGTGNGGAPVAVGGSAGAAGEAEGFTTVSAQTPAVAAPPTSAYTAPAPREEDQRLKSGVFLGVQGGQGKVYEGIDQDMLGFNAGYRWRAGPVTLIGVEAAVGKLARISDHDGAYVPSVEFGSLGGMARFNFGDSPLFAVVRLGYWSANSNGESNDRVSGGYAGAGLGVDVGRHASLSVLYTNYLYANDYYDSDEDITINRAEVLNVGAEVRF